MLPCSQCICRQEITEYNIVLPDITTSVRIANSSKYQSSQTTHVCNNALQYPTEKEENLYNSNTGISVDHSFTHRTDSKDRKFEICALMTQYMNK